MEPFLSSPGPRSFPPVPCLACVKAESLPTSKANCTEASVSFSWLRLRLKMNLKPSSLATLSRPAINRKFRALCLSRLVQVCVTHENRLRHNQRVQCDGKPGLGGPPESPDDLHSRSKPLTSHTALDRAQGPQGPEACWVLPSVHTLARCRAW